MTAAHVVDRVLERLSRGGADAAVVDGQGVASTDELRQRTLGVAAALRRAGVASGERVGILAPRGRSETAALLGTWAVGATPLPLEASSPPQRNRTILAGCGARVVLASAVAGAQLGDGFEVVSDTTVVDLDALLAPLADEAIVLHTSGSTGSPRGVPVTHDGVDAFVDWMTREFDVRPGDRVAALAGLSFDLALFEQLAPLAAGGAIVRPDEAASLSAQRVERFLRDGDVAIVYAVPSFFVRLLAAAPEPRLPRLRCVLFAGERFPVATLRQLRDAFPDATFANLFGPTETNVCTFHRLGPGEPHDAGLPIGVPCPYAEVLLVPEDGDAPCDEGEICVRGPTVLARYVGGNAAPLRTVTVPGRGGRPFVRTGDLARRDSGLLHFLGRRDRMLKVRGYRVEPGEVEAALTSHPAVADAAVRRVESPSLGEVLAADVELRPGATVDVREIRAHAAGLVPSYMVPVEIAVVAGLARTARGKREEGRP